MKKAITALVGTGIFLVASGAAAQQYGWSGNYQPTAPSSSSGTDNLGQEGQIVFGVDRVMGVAWDSIKVDTSQGNVSSDATYKATNVALFGMGNAPNVAAVAGGGSSFGGSYGLMPRLALDFFPIESLSLGGSFMFLSQSTTADINNGTTSTSQDGPTTTTILFHPRIGYNYAFDETFSIWPRAGITYVHTNTTVKGTGGAPDQDFTWGGLDGTLEVLLGISPFSNFALLLGPFVDFPFSGTATVPSATNPNQSQDFDAKVTSFGLTTSVVAYY
jgi:hypothetical protein